MRPAGRMRAAKEFPAARDHFGETSTLKLFPSSNLCDTISKAQPPIEPSAYHAGITQSCSTSLSSVSGFTSSSIVM